MSVKDPLAAIAAGLTRGREAREESELFCYVALGDSFTAGVRCPPEERWADRLAASLRAVRSPLGYYNLAVEGATSADVLEQVGPALQLEPDLVTVICGANDVLTSVRPDIGAYAERLSAILERLRRGLSRVAILTATSPERWRFLELGPRTRARVLRGIRSLNEATREVANAHGVACLDVAHHPGLDEPENFTTDGLHPSPAGHERAAVELARALDRHFGIETATTTEDQR